MGMLTCNSCSFTCKMPPDRAHTRFLQCPLAGEQVLESTPGPAEIVVLLYYSYVAIEHVESAVNWHASLCQHLGLKGRVRIASEGVNVVLDGEKEAITIFQDAVTEDGRWGSIQFKLSGLNPGKKLSEQRFSALSVKSCAEVVSLGLSRDEFPPSNGATHLPPSKWHATLQELARCPDKGKDVVLFDTRNVYESRIGQFQCPGATTLAPAIRQFTDFPKFVDEHVEALRGKTVLMYCTGGVRCERASAYVIRRLQEAQGDEEAAAARVFQLEGGICSYLTERLGAQRGGGAARSSTAGVEGGGEGEGTGEGGRGREGGAAGAEGEEGAGEEGEGAGEEEGWRSFFRGKNFVFDRRRFEPLHDGRVLGRCHQCSEPHDDYDNGPECRCQGCRLLLLLCDACRAHREWPLARSGCIEELLCGSDQCLGQATRAAASGSAGQRRSARARAESKQRRGEAPAAATAAMPTAQVA